MWLFSRHGTRYPRNDPEPGGEDDGKVFRAVQGREMELDALTQQMPILRDALIQNQLSGRGELCAEDLQNLRDWTIDIPQSWKRNWHLPAKRKCTTLANVTRPVCPAYSTALTKTAITRYLY